MKQVQSIDSLLELTDQFDLFLFDQFGVLHDGINAYLGMADVLAQLKALGKRVSVISNSGKRAHTNAARLSRFGYDANLVDAVYSSGEVAWHHLQQRVSDHEKKQTQTQKGASATAAMKVFVIATDEDRSAIDGLSLEETMDVDSCDLILIAGQGERSRGVVDYRKLFAQPISRGVPAICTNPDTFSLTSATQTVPGPGQIASIYKACGGHCDFIGKPHPEIYQHILQVEGMAASRTVCIGDSLEHDIVGAAGVGCASVLVTTGIHQGISSAERHRLMCEHASPDYLLVNG